MVNLQKVDAFEIVQLLGCTLADDRVQNLLAFAGTANRKVKIKRGETDAAIDCSSHGLVFNFEDAPSTANLPDGTLVLAAVHAMAEGVEGHRQFSGTLPFGLNFKMNQAQVEKVLGKHDWSSPILPILHWNNAQFQLVVEFFD